MAIVLECYAHLQNVSPLGCNGDFISHVYMHVYARGLELVVGEHKWRGKQEWSCAGRRGGAAGALSPRGMPQLAVRGTDDHWHARLLLPPGEFRVPAAMPQRGRVLARTSTK